MSAAVGKPIRAQQRGRLCEAASVDDFTCRLALIVLASRIALLAVTALLVRPAALLLLLTGLTAESTLLLLPLLVLVALTIRSALLLLTITILLTCAALLLTVLAALLLLLLTVAVLLACAALLLLTLGVVFLVVVHVELLSPDYELRTIGRLRRSAATASTSRLLRGYHGEMTYCLGMLLDAGLIMIADTRTNAGIDNFSSFKKLHTLADEPDRQIFACTAGNLSMSQTVMGLLQQGLPSAEDSDAGISELTRTVHGATSMFRAAQLVGEAVQIANLTVGEALRNIHIDSWVALLLGGRIGDGPQMLFLIYNAGNFIECTPEVPFLQIGERKYGKPILDRGLTFQTPLHEAVKFGFLSFDSTIQSNLGVARPLDLMVMPRQRSEAVLLRRIEEDDHYYNDLSERWSRYLHQATEEIPNPPWMPGTGAG